MSRPKLIHADEARRRMAASCEKEIDAAVAAVNKAIGDATSVPIRLPVAVMPADAFVRSQVLALLGQARWQVTPPPTGGEYYELRF